MLWLISTEFRWLENSKKETLLQGSEIWEDFMDYEVPKLNLGEHKMFTVVERTLRRRAQREQGLE